MNYSLSEIATLIHAAPHAWPARTIRQLIIDSRKLAHIDEALFFAIRGERHDGHQFIEDLYARGLRNFVVEALPSNKDQFSEAAFLVVANTTHALQQLAAHHRSRFTYPVVAVTGSNGKTIVKEWLWQILRDHYNIVRSPKSFNSQVGVPLSVWQMGEEHTLAIFEAGISRAGEMERLEKI
ncbi:MAG: Mur ligase family protein, partial [Bacteroidia bacterium]